MSVAGQLGALSHVTLTLGTRPMGEMLPGIFLIATGREKRVADFVLALKKSTQGLLDGPVVKTPCSRSREPGGLDSVPA